jgi:uncharacterized protein with ParB-like and HNH nuclease domain
MEITNLNKSITEILKDKYIVPLYQRNFAWGEEEINQLLQDLYESFKKYRESNYFIGSLVVLKRKNGDYEIIDGQQRLTAITLIAKILSIEEIKEPKLFYDSRPEVEAFFSSFYRTGETSDVTFDFKVSHLINAVDIINETKLKADEENSPTIRTLGNELESFKMFVGEKVILVRVEIPDDTDVANYFEIMNNRGEQLQKHEILKAKLIHTIRNETGEHDKAKQAIFAKIWDACSQMNIYIQKSFSNEKGNRNLLFGDKYDNIYISKIDNLNIENEVNEKRSLDDIILNWKVDIKGKVDATNQPNESIIDFSNFLMHIFKLLYNKKFQEATRNEKDTTGSSIPLNEKDLLTVFDIIENKIDPMYFISKLLFYRTVFDRYILKTAQSDNTEGGFRWSLEKPIRYDHLDFKNTFDDQDRIIKCLSMLQVSYRTRKYKNWLQVVLSWFSEDNNFMVLTEDYKKKLDDLVCKYYDENSEYIEINKENLYSKGTNTPHFLFNFVDYLYWVESQKDEQKQKFNFDFKYRNSIEHHRPQSRKQNVEDKFIDCLGNLCLVSKSSNSKMNNEEPSGKAITYNSDNLTPKRKIMYEITRNSLSELKWGKDEIYNHYSDIVELLERRNEILRF